mmetsp:Transcript_10614/g.46000  ORF Transcript_10614/g.46000 Transcript_10614/m.46000 type:complete len:254 (+) Transcript_10614:104-865(+)
MPFVNTLFIASEGVSTANSLTVAPNTSRHQRKNAVPMPRLRQPRRMKMCASLGGSPRLLSISHGGATFSNVSVYPIASPSASSSTCARPRTPPVGPPRGSFPTLGSSAANAVDSVWSAASSNEVTSRTEKPGGKRLFRSSAAASIAAPFRSRDRMPSPGLTARIAGLSTEAVSWSTTRSETRRLFSPRDAHGRDEAPKAGSEHRMSVVTRLLEGVSHGSSGARGSAHTTVDSRRGQIVDSCTRRRNIVFVALP